MSPPARTPSSCSIRPARSGRLGQAGSVRPARSGRMAWDRKTPPARLEMKNRHYLADAAAATIQRTRPPGKCPAISAPTLPLQPGLRPLGRHPHGNLPGVEHPDRRTRSQRINRNPAVGSRLRSKAVGVSAVWSSVLRGIFGSFHDTRLANCAGLIKRSWARLGINLIGSLGFRSPFRPLERVLV